MNKSHDQYIFSDKPQDREKSRLQLIESIFDPISQQWCLESGLKRGYHCLEAGAGAGSMARWLANQAGHGHLTAIDKDTRYLEPDDHLLFNVISSDINQTKLPNSSYDLIHTRYFLIHVPNDQSVWTKFADLLKPGGFLVAEEPDFSTIKFISGTPEQNLCFDKMRIAIDALFTQAGLLPNYGQTLEERAMKAGLKIEKIETEHHKVSGGSPIAQMMGRSAEQLAEAYLKSEKLSKEDLEHYISASNDPQFSGVYYSTIRILAKK